MNVQKVNVTNVKVGAEIRRLRIAKGMSLPALARKSGWDSGGLSKLERGLQGYSTESLAALASALGVESWELARAGTVGRKTIPKADAASAYAGAARLPVLTSRQAVEGRKAIGSADIQEWKTMFNTERVSSSAFLWRVTGDSMEGKFPEGCLVVVDPDVEAANESFVLMQENQNIKEVTFRKLWLDGNRPYLVALNKMYPAREVPPQALLLGVVVQGLILVK